MARHIPSAKRASRTFDASPGEPWRVPYPPRGHAWHKDSVAAWKSVTASGLVGTLLPMDEAALLRWFRMTDKLNHALDDPSATPAAIKSLSAEVRLLEQSLGLSPLARMQMRLSPSEPKRSGSLPTSGVRLSDLDSR